MKKLRIYSMRSWVCKRITRGAKRGSIEHTYTNEKVFVNNLASAKRWYAAELSKVKFELTYADFAKCELFVPHIFKDGTLAYWPDNNKYIKKYNSAEVKNNV